MSQRVVMICSAIGRLDAGAIPQRTHLECVELQSRHGDLQAIGCAFTHRKAAQRAYPVHEVQARSLPRPLASWALWSGYEKQVMQQLSVWGDEKPIRGIIETEQWLGASLHRFAEQRKIPLVSFFHCDRIGITEQGASAYNAWLTRRLVQNTRDAIQASQGLVCLNTSMETKLQSHITPQQQLFRSTGICETHAVEQPPSNPSKLPPILLAGRLSPEKNPLLGIEAFLRCTTPERRLIIAGDGPLRGSVEAAIKRAGHPNIDYRGALPHAELMQLMYEEQPLVLIPSLSDQFPSVIIEALDRGCPVIASDLDGAHDILEGGRYGELVQTPTAEAWAHAIDQLLQDASRRDSLSKAGPSHASEYHPERVIPSVCDFYDTLFGQPS